MTIWSSTEPSDWWVSCMSNARIDPRALSAALSDEMRLYTQEVTRQLNQCSQKTARKLVKITRSSAPKGKRGSYRASIASKQLQSGPTGDTYIWYVKGKDARLTHLLVHGHATRNGGRTKASPFLHNALDQVLREYEKEVKRVLRDGK